MSVYMFGFVTNADPPVVEAMKSVAKETFGLWVEEGPGQHWFCWRNSGYRFDDGIIRSVKQRLREICLEREISFPYGEDK